MGGFGDLVNLDYGIQDPNSPSYDPNWNTFLSSNDPYGITTALGGMEGNAGIGGASGEQLYYDNQTRQLVTLAQAQAIDPTFQPSNYTGTSDILRNTSGAGGTGAIGNTTTAGYSEPPSGSDTGAWSQILNNLPGSLAALGSLGLTGASIAALFGQGNQPNKATSTQTSTPTALSDPRVQSLLGSAGTGTGSALTGNTGLLGAANQAAGNLQGPTGLLQNQISAIPQLNPQIQQAIQGNALGFSQGQVPTLNNPQAQQYFGNMLNAQNAQVDYNQTNSLANAIDQLRQRGFAGGSEIFREGAPAAAMGPIVAAANLAKAQNLGNVNAQQLNYAAALPTLGANLNAAQLGAQGVPFSAYTSAVGSQSAIPQNLIDSLMNQGQTTTRTDQAASPNLVQTLGQIAPLLGAAGGMATGATANGTNPLAGLYGGLTGLFNG